MNAEPIQTVNQIIAQRAERQVQTAVLQHAFSRFGALPIPPGKVGASTAPGPEARSGRDAPSLLPKRALAPILGTSSESPAHFNCMADICQLMIHAMYARWPIYRIRPSTPEMHAAAGAATGAPASPIVARLEKIISRGEYEAATKDLVRICQYLPAPEFLHLLWTLAHTISVTRHVIDHAEKAIGFRPRRIETASAEKSPTAHYLHLALDYIENNLANAAMKPNLVTDAFLRMSYEKIAGKSVEPHVATPLEPISRESHRATIILAEYAFHEGDLSITEKLLSKSNIQPLPIALVHRRLGEIALKNGDGRKAAHEFELALLVPGELWTTADISTAPARQLLRVGDYYTIFLHNNRYVAVPHDRPLRGLTSIAGQPVLLLSGSSSVLRDMFFRQAIRLRRFLAANFNPQTTETSDPATPQSSDLLRSIRVGAITMLKKAIKSRSVKYLAQPIHRLAFAVVRKIPRSWFGLLADVLLWLIYGRRVPPQMYAESLDELLGKLPLGTKVRYKA